MTHIVWHELRDVIQWIKDEYIVSEDDEYHFRFNERKSRVLVIFYIESLDQ